MYIGIYIYIGYIICSLVFRLMYRYDSYMLDCLMSDRTQMKHCSSGCALRQPSTRVTTTG